MRKYIVILISLVLIMCNFSVFASTLNFDIDYDGSQIFVQSENNSTISVTGILPGETKVSYLYLNNKSNSEIKVYLTAKMEESKLSEILEVELLDEDNNKLFDGIYDGLTNVEINLEGKSTSVITVVSKLPKEAGNEYQQQQGVIEFLFTANAEEVEQEIPEPEPEPEPKPEPEPEPKPELEPEDKEIPQAGQTRIIYIALIIIIITLIVILIRLLTRKKDDENAK